MIAGGAVAADEAQLLFDALHHDLSWRPFVAKAVLADLRLAVVPREERRRRRQRRVGTELAAPVFVLEAERHLAFAASIPHLVASLDVLQRGPDLRSAG